jgi:hypothetical protein
MVETRHQVAMRSKDWVVTGRLKEVRIPALVTKKVVESLKEAQMPAIFTKDIAVKHTGPPHTKIKANLNASSQLLGLTQIFGTVDLIFRLYGPSECRTVLAILREKIRDFITNYGVNENWTPMKPDAGLDRAAVHKVLQEVYRVASSMGEREWNSGFGVFKHAVKWALVLFKSDGKTEGYEYSEGSSEVHEGMYDFVGWALK